MHVYTLSFNLASWPAEADFFFPLFFFLVLVVNEVAERLAFFGIAVNMVAYLVFEMHQSLPNAATHVTDWIGAAYVLTLFGAFCADAYLGRFRTIVVFSCIYTVVRNQDFPLHLVFPHGL
jgi:dipeptide/tripeptide permease